MPRVFGATNEPDATRSDASIASVPQAGFANSVVRSCRLILGQGRRGARLRFGSAGEARNTESLGAGDCAGWEGCRDLLGDGIVSAWLLPEGPERDADGTWAARRPSNRFHDRWVRPQDATST